MCIYRGYEGNIYIFLYIYTYLYIYIYMRRGGPAPGGGAGPALGGGVGPAPGGSVFDFYNDCYDSQF